MSSFYDVLRFQLRSEQLPLDQRSSIPEMVTLYETLIKEEYKELQEAIVDGTNESNILNEALDLIWVVIGLCHAKGYEVDEAWNHLMRSNMKKLQIDPVTGSILRHPNGKIKKPENWKKPDFSDFVPKPTTPKGE